jgi:hypothetical protein
MLGEPRVRRSRGQPPHLPTATGAGMWWTAIRLRNTQ